MTAAPSTADALRAAVMAVPLEDGAVMAVDARHLPTGRRLEIRGEEVFPSASVIKLAILGALYDEREQGRLDFRERLELGAADKVDGAGVLKEMHDGLQLTLEEMARLMIVISDNTASNILIDRLGTDCINGWMKRQGMPRSCLGRKFYDFEAAARGRDNLANAGEFANLMQSLEQREIVSAAASEEMLAILRRQQVTNKIPHLLPAGTVVANKTGTISSASHDVGIVYAPSGPIVLAVMTRGVGEAAAEAAIRQVSRLVYDAWSAA